LNKWILIASDSSGLNRADRRTLQSLILPKTYHRKFQQALHLLQEFGIELCETKLMAHKLIEHFQEETASGGSSIEPPNIMASKLLSSENIRKWLRETNTHTITVAKGTIVTALAADFIKENGISLVYE